MKARIDEFEDCPDMKDDGSEPSEKFAGATDTARRLEFPDATKNKTTKGGVTGVTTQGRSGRGGGGTNGRK
jgi:hypothetical protein